MRFAGSAEADVGWGGNLNDLIIIAICVGNIRAKNY